MERACEDSSKTDGETEEQTIKVAPWLQWEQGWALGDGGVEGAL